MAKLNTATSLLFHVAARSPLLAREFGVKMISRSREGSEPKLEFIDGRRHLLDTEPGAEVGAEILCFSPDKLAAKLGKCSSGEYAMYCFILNVWNPGYAKSNGWHFDLFHALSSLDTENAQAIAWWLERPVWP